MHATRIPRHACAALALLFVLLLSGTAFPADSLDLPLMLTPTRAQIPLSVDSDGDGIPDQWEIHGYWDNGTFVDLPAMGANPKHKDLFVWMDYMVRPDSTSLAPSQAVIDNIKAVFNNAPVQNPDGTTGIHIHPILKNQVPYQETLGDNQRLHRGLAAVRRVEAGLLQRGLRQDLPVHDLGQHL